MSYTMYTPLNVWLDPASVTDVVAYIQNYLSENTIYSEEEIEELIHDYLIAHPELIGGVHSVNGKTGTVVLSASDINTANNVTIESVLSSLSSQISSIASSVATNTTNITNLTGRVSTAETDISNLKSKISNIKDALNKIGYNVQTYNATNIKSYVVNDKSVKNGDMLFFNAVSCDLSTVSDLTFYGKNRSNQYVELARVPVGSYIFYKVSDDYIGFSVSVFPYGSSTNTNYTFEIGESDVSLFNLSSALNKIGYIQKFTATNTKTYTDNNVSFNNGDMVCFNAVSCDLSTVSDLTFYGKNSSNQYVELARVPIGTSVFYKATEDYNGITVSIYPYGSNTNTNYTFEIGISESDVSLFNLYQNVIGKDVLADFSVYGKYISSASSTVFDYLSVSQGEIYSLYVWDIVGNNGTVNPRVYIIYNDNTSTELSHDPVADGKMHMTITVPASAKSIRLYMAKASGASQASCNYALIKYYDGVIGSIESRLSSVESNVSVRKNLLNNTTCKIFQKVVCCGDSYTAGYIHLTGSTEAPTNENYAWPHYMSTMTGNEWVNCGETGSNCITWQTRTRGLPKATTEGVTQAYVLGLMLNDASDTERHVDVGVISDIGTDNSTYYAQMSKIIRELNTISPLAKIFVNTVPDTNSIYTAYNQAVRDIVNAYKDTYPVHCIDLYQYRDLYTNASLTGDSVNGHYTAIGYEQFAEIYAYILSDYINTHISDFQDVYALPFAN